MKISEAWIDYSEAAQQAEQFHPIFRVYQKLAANKIEKRNGCNPFPYGEGTAASIIRKMPPRVLRHLPVGRLRNISDEFMSIVVEFIVEEIFARNCKREEGFIQSLWHILEDGMTMGFNTVTPYFTKVNGAYTVDYRLHYWADVFPAPGVKNINSGDVFIRDWWSKSDVEQLIEMASEDKTLNKKELQKLIEEKPTSRDSSNQSEANKQASVSNLGYEVIRYYVLEDGKYMLYIFAPNSGDGTNRFIQKKELPSRGHVTFYYDPDFETAFGRSILGLIGGMQIDLDQMQRNRRKIQEIETNPMLVAKGYTQAKIQLKPQTVINLPPEASLEAFSFNTPSLDRFQEDKKASQADIYQIAGYPEPNTSGTSTADAGIGKTPTAIKTAQQNIDDGDNKIAENLKLFLEQFFTEALKIYFYNLPEAFLLEVSAEYAARLEAVAPERFVAPGLILVENDLDLYDYEIDIESGKDDVNEMKLGAVTRTLGLLEQSPMVGQRVAQIGILDDLIKEVIFASGLNNDSIAKKLAFLDNPNGAGTPSDVPFAGQPIPPEMAAEMADPALGGGGIQPNNPIRQG